MSNLIAQYLGLALGFYIPIKTQIIWKLFALEVSSVFAKKSVYIFLSYCYLLPLLDAPQPRSLK